MTNNQYIIIGVFVLAFIALKVIKRLGQISLDDAKKLLRDGAILVDVRTSQEFSGGHIKGAINIPLSNLAGISKKASIDKNVIVYCQTGTRSMSAKRQLKSMGYINVHNLGNIGRWKD